MKKYNKILFIMFLCLNFVSVLALSNAESYEYAYHTTTLTNSSLENNYVELDNIREGFRTNEIEENSTINFSGLENGQSLDNSTYDYKIPKNSDIVEWSNETLENVFIYLNVYEVGNLSVVNHNNHNNALKMRTNTTSDYMRYNYYPIQNSNIISFYFAFNQSSEDQIFYIYDLGVLKFQLHTYYDKIKIYSYFSSTSQSFYFDYNSRTAWNHLLVSLNGSACVYVNNVFLGEKYVNCSSTNRIYSLGHGFNYGISYLDRIYVGNDLEIASNYQIESDYNYKQDSNTDKWNGTFQPETIENPSQPEFEFVDVFEGHSIPLKMNQYEGNITSYSVFNESIQKSFYYYSDVSSNSSIRTKFQILSDSNLIHEYTFAENDYSGWNKIDIIYTYNWSQFYINNILIKNTTIESNFLYSNNLTIIADYFNEYTFYVDSISFYNGSYEYDGWITFENNIGYDYTILNNYSIVHEENRKNVFKFLPETTNSYAIKNIYNETANFNNGTIEFALKIDENSDAFDPFGNDAQLYFTPRFYSGINPLEPFKFIFTKEKILGYETFGIFTEVMIDNTQFNAYKFIFSDPQNCTVLINNIEVMNFSEVLFNSSAILSDLYFNSYVDTIAYIDSIDVSSVVNYRSGRFMNPKDLIESYRLPEKYEIPKFIKNEIISGISYNNTKTRYLQLTECNNTKIQLNPANLTIPLLSEYKYNGIIKSDSLYSFNVFNGLYYEQLLNITDNRIYYYNILIDCNIGLTADLTIELHDLEFGNSSTIIKEISFYRYMFGFDFYKCLKFYIQTTNCSYLNLYSFDSNIKYHPLFEQYSYEHELTNQYYNEESSLTEIDYTQTLRQFDILESDNVYYNYDNFEYYSYTTNMEKNTSQFYYNNINWSFNSLNLESGKLFTITDYTTEFLNPQFLITLKNNSFVSIFDEFNFTYNDYTLYFESEYYENFNYTYYEHQITFQFGFTPSNIIFKCFNLGINLNIDYELSWQLYWETNINVSLVGNNGFFTIFTNTLYESLQPIIHGYYEYNLDFSKQISSISYAGYIPLYYILYNANINISIDNCEIIPFIQYDIDIYNNVNRNITNISNYSYSNTIYETHTNLFPYATIDEGLLESKFSSGGFYYFNMKDKNSETGFYENIGNFRVDENTYNYFENGDIVHLWNIGNLYVYIYADGTINHNYAIFDSNTYMINNSISIKYYSTPINYTHNINVENEINWLVRLYETDNTILDNILQLFFPFIMFALFPFVFRNLRKTPVVLFLGILTGFIVLTIMGYLTYLNAFILCTLTLVAFITYSKLRNKEDKVNYNITRIDQND